MCDVMAASLCVCERWWGSAEECAHVHACQDQRRTLGVPVPLTSPLWHWAGSLTESGAGHTASNPQYCYHFFLRAGLCFQASTHYVLILTRELVAWIQAYKLLKQLLLLTEPPLRPLLWSSNFYIFTIKIEICESGCFLL